MRSPLQIKQDFVVLSPSKEASIERADETLCERLDTKYGDFAGHELISCYEFEADWASREAHPHGDEIVLLIYGEVEFILESELGEKSYTLTEQGQYIVVPKGVWHTAKIKRKSKLLFVTPGQGTEHKANL